MLRSAKPWSPMLLAGLCAWPAAHGQDGVEPRQSANRSLQVLTAVHTTNGGQEGALRRCRGYMDEAVSAEKLGAHDMALRNWQRAARGCRADAVIACQGAKKDTAAEECAGVSR